MEKVPRTGYLVPAICKKLTHSQESVERYIHDYETIRLLATKFDDVDLISRIVRFKDTVVKQYLDLIPPDSKIEDAQPVIPPTPGIS